MSEIEKMYENAGVEPQYKKRTECKDGYTVGHPCEKGIACINCNRSVFEDVMPPFTAEKQLSLLQLLARIESADYFQFFFYEIKQEWVFRLNMLTELSCESAYIYESRNKNFDECISGLLNLIWQDLTSEEKQQVKGILE